MPLAMYAITLLEVEAEFETFVEEKILASICKIDFAFMQLGRV